MDQVHDGMDHLLKLSFTWAGQALIDASEAMKELGEVKDALDMEVKQNFIDPLQNLHDKDLKEIQVGKTTSTPPKKAVWAQITSMYCLPCSTT